MTEAPPLLIYQEDRARVLQGLREGRLEYADLTAWSFMDKFLALWIDRGFFNWAGQTFPSPRQRHHVPVWFLLAAYTQLKLHTEGAFHRLPYVLQSASVLRTLGVQLGVPGGDGGFNRRHRKPRRSPVDQDTVRKFMKDTDPQRLQAWYAVDVAAWLRAQRVLEGEGIDILDATLLPVPDNPHYEHSAVVPLTREGHYPRSGEGTVPTRCYKVTSLMRVVGEGAGFLYRGVLVSPGSTSTLTTGEALVEVARQVPGRGALRLLVCDREFCDGATITRWKRQGIDVVVPLKAEMDIYTDALALSRLPETRWERLPLRPREEETVRERVAALIPDLRSWETCEVPLVGVVVRETKIDGTVTEWVLVTTSERLTAAQVVACYQLRTQIEERHRQFKGFWGLGAFTSPTFSLVVAHIVFLFLAYTLLQAFLHVEGLAKLARRAITTLQADERVGRGAVIVYGDGAFAIFSVMEFFNIVLALPEEARQRLKRRVGRLLRNRSPGPEPETSLDPLDALYYGQRLW
jgi:hypothetical protein